MEEIWYNNEAVNEGNLEAGTKKIFKKLLRNPLTSDEKYDIIYKSRQERQRAHQAKASGERKKILKNFCKTP